MMFESLIHPRFMYDTDEGGSGGGAPAPEGEGQPAATATKPAAEDKPEGEGKQEQAPPWGDDPDKFDPDKAWRLIQNVRGDLDKTRARAEEAERKASEFEDSQKTDQQKLEERASNAEKKAADLEPEVLRLRVALRKGLTLTQAKRLVGDTEEELEADADELLADFRGGAEEEGDKPKPRRPRERVRTGAAPAAKPEETDPVKLAEKVSRRY